MIQVFILVSDHFWLYRGTMGLEIYNGKGSNGGVWEWTSTTFDNHEGLVPTQLFTGYSTDFFDTKHQVAVSISYALATSSYIQDLFLTARRLLRNHSSPRGSSHAP